MRMETIDQIAVVEFCTYHDADESFIIALHQSGLIELTIENDQTFIPVSQINDLEKFLRLHYDLDINLEGIETIHYLQNRVAELNRELTNVRNRLMFYEDYD